MLGALDPEAGQGRAKHGGYGVEMRRLRAVIAELRHLDADRPEPL